MLPAETKLRSQLSAKGLRFIAPRGNAHAPVWIVGEAGGAHEESSGLAFVGSSGQELDRMLVDAGFATPAQDCYFTNPFKVRPPDNDLERLSEYGILEDTYLDQFFEELSEHKPTIVVACGATALSILCPQTQSKRDRVVSITKWRGSLLRSDKLCWDHYVIPVLHPAAVLREWSERQIAVFCYERAREEALYHKEHGVLQPLPARELIVQPGADVVKDYLREAIAQDTPVSNDIEMLGVHRGGRTKYIIPDMIAVARSPWLAMSFSLWDYDVAQLAEIWRLLDELLRTHPQIGQNYISFDAVWLEYLGFSPEVNLCNDTMVLHHVLNPEFPHKLEFLGMQYTREPYWKDEGRLFKRSEGIEKKMRYNAKDAAATYEIFLRELEEGAERNGARDTQLLDESGQINTERLLDLAWNYTPERLRSIQQRAGASSNDAFNWMRHLWKGCTPQMPQPTVCQSRSSGSDGHDAQGSGAAGDDTLPIRARVYTGEHTSGQERLPILQTVPASLPTARSGLFAPLEFYCGYELPLTRAFHAIEKRGVRVDMSRLAKLRDYIVSETAKALDEISLTVGRPAAAGAKIADFGDLSCAAVAKAKGIKPDEVFNVSSPDQVKSEFKKLKLTLPTKRGKQSSDEKSIQAVFAKTGHPLCKSTLRVRELNKVKGTYVDAVLADETLYTSYVTTATVTGRRGSRTNVFGLGGNAQNLPKHSDLAKMFRECLVARSGKIFVQADQKGAEDWIVQSIISDQQGHKSPGLVELEAGVNRHKKRAAFLFSKPETECTKETPFYLMAKKAGHAGNYDMQFRRLAEEFTKEGFFIPENYCEWLLTKFHEYEPGIRQVFHKWVQKTLMDTRTLITPLGRERIFYALRPFSDNSEAFREGYAQIPQSTVGDNTGMAILYYEIRQPGHILMDGHDSVLAEVDDSLESVRSCISLLERSFNRDIRFPNGLTLQIPLEIELGYDMKAMRTCPDTSITGLTTTYNTLSKAPNRPVIITSGAQPQSSSPVCDDTVGTNAAPLTDTECTQTPIQS